MGKRSDKFLIEMDALKHASATLGGGNLRDVVKLPHGEDVNEWIAANIVDLFNQVSMLYGTISEFCTSESCPKMTAGERHEYNWSDGRGAIMNCSAPEYIEYLMSWIQQEIDNEATFPSQIGKHFSPNFIQIAQAIMKRLFRVYAHIYHQHFTRVEQLKAIEHLNTSFKHFMLFVQEFNLIDQKQLEPLSELVKELIIPQGESSSHF